MWRQKLVCYVFLFFGIFLCIQIGLQPYRHYMELINDDESSRACYLVGHWDDFVALSVFYVAGIKKLWKGLPLKRIHIVAVVIPSTSGS